MKVKDLMVHVLDKVDIFTVSGEGFNYLVRDGHFGNIPDSVSEMEVKNICVGYNFKLKICVYAN